MTAQHGTARACVGLDAPNGCNTLHQILRVWRGSLRQNDSRTFRIESQETYVKKFFAITSILVLALLAVSASAQTSNMKSVTLKAISPEYITLSQTMSPTITFTFQPGSTFANGDQNPGLSLQYNLASSKTITVCAYLSGDLVGTNSANIIPMKDVNFNVGNPGTQQFTGTCGTIPNAVTWTQFSGQQGTTAVSSTGMFIATGGAFAPVPDTYTGTMNIIAQVF